MKAAPLSLRLFLEGIEVPVISAQVASQPDQPAAAAIQIVPTDLALEFLPRTLVHLFYLDGPLTQFQRGGDEGTSGVTITQSEKDAGVFNADETSYKLLFAGEIIGYNFAKTPVSRQLVIQCMDLSSYWDTCYQWFADYSRNGGAFTDKSRYFVGAGSGLFDNVAGGHKWVIGQLLQSKPKSPEYSDTSGLLGGIIHLLEAVGGVKPRGSTFRGYSGANPFFTIAELRYNLLGQIGAVASDKTSVKLYAAKAFRSWLRSGMTSLGNLLSFRDIVNHVNRYVFHNIYPNPCAHFVAGGESITYSSSGRVYTDTQAGKQARSLIRAALSRLKSAKVALSRDVQGFSVLEDTLSDDINVRNSPGQYREPIAQTSTSSRNSPNVWEAAFSTNQASVSLGAAEELLKGAGTSDVSQVLSLVVSAKTSVKEALAKFKVGGVSGFADSLDQLIDSMMSSDIVSVLELVESAIEDLETASGSKRGRPRVKNTTVTGAHLYSQLFLPESFFVPPPRCNVLFPDQYYSFGYNRNFLREVTRLSCHSGLGILAGRGDTRILGRNYFAPSVRGADGRTLIAATKGGGTILLPHEVHSGIIPKFEWVTQGHSWGVKAAKTTGGDNLYNAGKVGYVQRLAHFQFYQHRWMSRNMNIEAIFNPRMVLGLPALIIDRGYEGSGDSFSANLLPTQYLGKVASISHNVGQTGGTTSISLSHCRTHRGVDDEFLNLLMREKKEKRVTEVVVDTEKLTSDPKAGGKHRQSYIRIVSLYMAKKLKGADIRGFGKVADVKASSSKARISELWLGTFGLSRKLLVDDTLPGDETSDWGVTEVSTVQIESTSTAQWAYGKTINLDGPLGTSAPTDRTVVTSVPDPEGQSKLRSWEVPRKITVKFEAWVNTGQYQRSDLSIEDALMPGWYSSVWKKDNISEKVYLPLLGVRSITDGASVGASDLLELADAQGGGLGQEGDVGSVGEESGYVDVMGEDGEDRVVELSRYKIDTSTVESAIDGLSIVYGMMKGAGQDIHEFINNYTHRDIATMRDILGTDNLRFGDRGEVEDENSMIEGFHSRAFGDYNVDMELGEDGILKAGTDSLKDLIPGKGSGDEIKLEPVIQRGKPPVAIPASMDPRGRARKRVRTYAEELSTRRGLKG